jgi:phosphatidylglycerophosphate synthase
MPGLEAGGTMADMKDFMYKGRDAGNKELFSMLFYRPAANFLLNSVFKHLNVTPNQITMLSLFIAVSGCAFFAFSAYPYVIIGVILLHLVYTLDMLDGQYARYKGLSSKFGKWFDAFIDVIKIAFIFLSLSYRAYYARGGDSSAFIFGFIALTNSFLTEYILNTREQIIKGATFEIKPAKDIYIGYEISLYIALSFFIVIDKIYTGLIFLAVAGALSWIKCYMTLHRYYFKNKKEIDEIL